MADLHRYERRFISSKKTLKKDKITEKNKDLILEFSDYCLVRGLSKPRIIKYIDTLRLSARIINKDFDKTTKKDIMAFVGRIQESKYSLWTKKDFKVMIKRFYKWLKGNDEIYPDEVKWIPTHLKKSELKLPLEGDLLTEEEVQRMIDSASNPRDKAFISFLYESGCRIGEIGNLKIKNIRFDKNGAVVTVFGKTGSRNIRVINSTPYLMIWLQGHPNRKNKESYLWVHCGKYSDNPISYGYLIKILRVNGKRAEVNKKVNPHAFRHARATFLANFLTEFQMNYYFGWVQGSDMPSIYVHMSGKQIDSAILELNGLKEKKEEKEVQLKPISCPRCAKINPANSKYCLNCAGILDIKVALELEAKEMKKKEVNLEVNSVMDKLLQDPEVQQLIMQKISSFS
jgi:integrase/recombinase XerD